MKENPLPCLRICRFYPETEEEELEEAAQCREREETERWLLAIFRNIKSVYVLETCGLGNMEGSPAGTGGPRGGATLSCAEAFRRWEVDVHAIKRDT